MVTKDNDLVDSDNNLRTVVDLNQTSSSTQPTSSSPPRLKIEQGAESVAKGLKSRQEQLQDEAKMALAQAGSMAHMQLEIKKQLQKKSPMAEMVGIPGLGERRRKKLGVRKLQDMNLTSIQVLYNDLQTQIENLNEELVHLLMERDELHMEQDSMLVDIEDLTRRAEEIAEKKNSTSAKDGQLKARRNDREEIRKKLAMGVDDDDCYDDQEDEDVGYKKPNLQSRLSSGLQICFMNESPGDTDSEGRSPRQHDLHDNIKMVTKDNDLVDSDNNLRTVVDLNQTSCSTQPTSSSPPRLKIEQRAESVAKGLKSRQEQLQDEAKMALAQAGSMAHMQLEIEKQLQKKSPMAEMVGIPGLGERRRKKLGVRKLQDMNLTSIQVLYNDLQTQIENLNEELVHLLMERDELHMEQDSMLVDIEDLTRRAEEIAEKKNSTSAKDGQLKDSKHKTSTSVKGKLPSR